MNRENLLRIVAEWLEEQGLPSMLPRLRPEADVANLKRVLAVVGPRRAGKTYFLY